MFLFVTLVEPGGMPEPLTFQLVVAHLDHDPWCHRCPRTVLVPGPPALGAGDPTAFAEALVGDELEKPVEDLDPVVVGKAAAMPDEVEAPGVVVEPEQQRADERADRVLVPAEAADDAVAGPRVLDLH
ncbi:MAG TPA: hypothetical protein VFB99_21040, partial [Vicinamibacterales bacterium]|nr:hypothetical protein [Vicinamibacterales bacterium]